MAKPGSGWNAAVEATLRTAPAPSSTICAQERAGQVVDGLDVEPDDLLLALEVGLEQRRDRAEPGVVADADDPALAGLQPRDERVPARPASVEVARLDVGVDAVREPQLLRQLAQPVGAARHEHEVVVAPGELARELGADPGRGAGDQDGGVERRRR